MLIFLSNHDIARIGDTFGHDPRRMKLAFVMLATLRGIPQLFYGDEMMFVTGNPQRDDGRLRMDFPGGWAGDPVNSSSGARARRPSNTARPCISSPKTIRTAISGMTTGKWCSCS